MGKLVILSPILVVILLFLIWNFAPNLLPQSPIKPQPAVLTFWGFWDEGIIRPIISEYQKQNPLTEVKYVKQSPLNYRTRIQTQIREGIGPDIFAIHNSWVPMFEGDLTLAPSDIFSIKEYQETFYPVAWDSLAPEGQVKAVPFSIDGLGMYVNEEILAGVGATVPKNWREFIDVSSKVTVKDQNGVIKTSGAALGSTLNVDFWPDILGMLLFEQPGVSLNNLATAEAAEVLKFYTSFITDPKKKSWDINLPNSTQSFASGKLAFYFGPSNKALEFKSMNPNLRFSVHPVPQLSPQPASYASFWAGAVSARGKNQKEAWKFLKFLTTQDAQRLMLKQMVDGGGIGFSYSRVDLASEQNKDPLLGAFVLQGPYYKHWYLSFGTEDKGLNDEMIKVFETGVNSVLAGTDPMVAAGQIDKEAKQVLQKYTGQN